MNKKYLLLLGLSFLLPLVSSESFGVGNPQTNGFGYGADLQGVTNLNLSSVNNSFYWQGYTPNSYNATYVFPLFNATSSNLSSYVPYVGASKNVNLNNFNLTNVMKVGIGTTTPEAPLHILTNTSSDFAFFIVEALNSHVAPIIRKDNNIKYAGLRFDSENKTEEWFIGLGDNRTTANSLLFRRNSSSNDMVINRFGNVGIGTTSPGFKLDVQGTIHTNATNPNITIQRGTSGGGQNGVVLMDYNGAADAMFGLDQSSGEIRIGAISNGGYYPTFYSNNAEAMRISTTGNVGIGTTSPSAMLQINQSSQTVHALKITRFNNTAGSQNGQLILLRDIADSATQFSVDSVGATNATRLNLNVANGGSGYILDAGDVSTIDNTQGYRFRQRTTTGSAIPILSIEPQFEGGAAYTAFFINTTDYGSSTTSTKLIDAQHNGTSRFTVLQNGLVGIGTSTPSNALDVRGIGNFSGDVYVNNGSIVGTLTNETGTYVPYIGAVKDVNLNGNNLTGLSSISAKGSFSTGNGSISIGYVFFNNSFINSSGLGSSAFGVVVSENSSIISSGTGSMASGQVFATNGTIRATGSASFGRGVVFGQNSSILVSSTNSFVLGYAGISPSLEGNSTIIATGQNSFIHGRAAFNSLIRATGINSFIHGGTGSNRDQIYAPGFATTIFASTDGNTLGDSKIIASGSGAIIFAYTSSPNSTIIASGKKSIIFSSANTSVSGEDTIAFGRNVNISGNNSLVIGLGLNNMQFIDRSNIFAVLNGAFAVNTTAPSESFEIGMGNMYLNGTGNPSLKMGQLKELNMYFDNTAKSLIINPQTVGAANVSILSSLNVSEKVIVAGNMQTLSRLIINASNGGPCDGTTESQVYYNITVHKAYICNSTQWTSMGDGSFY